MEKKRFNIYVNGKLLSECDFDLKIEYPRIDLIKQEIFKQIELSSLEDKVLIFNNLLNHIRLNHKSDINMVLVMDNNNEQHIELELIK